MVANCTPFNHPLMIMCKSLAAVLASGCVTVVKPSEYTPLTTLRLAQIFTEAGLPPGVFNVVSGVNSDGLTTVTQPLASTAASDLHMIIRGWLNGVQLATTPIGVRSV
ncbi:MAG TPA: aldehyde dehydrogenase family protein [Burkholderiaceae bacterium]